MTKERRLAIEMWEHIAKNVDETHSAFVLKNDFLLPMIEEISWQNGCWFCQYVRKDYRIGHVGREDIDHCANKCECCPLYKYEIARGNRPAKRDACGCDATCWYHKPLYDLANSKDSTICKKAANTIVKLLKGEEV